MYATPVLFALDPTAAQALCCTIEGPGFIIQTVLCPFPTCDPEGIKLPSLVGDLPCTLSVGPVTVSGN